jgi:GNAT superfamily N-acetyltransferase
MGAPETARFFVWSANVMVEIEAENIVLRQARSIDAPDLARLRFASLVEMGLIPPSDAASFIRRAGSEFFRLLRDDRLAAWLLFEGEEPVGCACALFWHRLPYATTSLQAEVAGVYVVPHLRRRGYATELVREAIATARGRGARKIVLSSSREAREIYARLGFKDEVQMVIRPER